MIVWKADIIAASGKTNYQQMIGHHTGGVAVQVGALMLRKMVSFVIACTSWEISSFFLCMRTVAVSGGFQAGNKEIGLLFILAFTFVRIPILLWMYFYWFRPSEWEVFSPLWFVIMFTVG